MSKKPTKTPSKKSGAAKVEAAAETPAAAPAKPKTPVLPPKPVPSHQQFLAKGVKPQARMKARIIRHQGR